MPKTTQELRTAGFAELQPGRIHVRCPGCGRKISNGLRAYYDPERATLVEVECAACGMGNFPEPAYFDVEGDEILDPPVKLA